jgi:hypothetical protein
MNDSPIPWMIDRGRTRHDQHEAIHLATLRAARMERTLGAGHLIARLRAKAAAASSAARAETTIAPDCCPA